MARAIEWAECELSVYQRGFLLVRFDFAHNVLIWKDSNRWFNNFVRGLPRETMELYKAAVLKFILERSQEEPKLASGTNESIWTLRYGYSDSEAEHSLSGTDIEAPAWLELKANIEEAGGRSFKL
ncbi:MAG: hypothetical protein Q4P08_01510 [Eubacteriales bacterium]|nr:hypothetical protein [Eubacteriales bacterium]